MGTVPTDGGQWLGIWIFFPSSEEQEMGGEAHQARGRPDRAPGTERYTWRHPGLCLRGPGKEAGVKGPRWQEQAPGLRARVEATW